MTTKICENCGKEHETTWKDKRFCCVKCKHTYIKRTWKEVVKEYPYLEQEA